MTTPTNTRLLNDQIQQQLTEIFKDLQQPVEILFFGQEVECEYCPDTLQLIQEVSELSDKFSLSVYDIEKDRETSQKFQVDKVPTIVLAAKNGEELVDYGIRFVGIPAGHEFGSLVNDLVMVSGRDSNLSESTRQVLSKLENPVQLQVFVTPSCGYCPQAVVLAHAMALESPMIRAEMIESTEFPELAAKFNVYGVPQTTINSGAGTVVGAVPEADLLAEIQKVAALTTAI